jgi:hypothetical protein
VVQEALTNAAKYAPGTEVSVTVVRTADRTCVEVEDTGPAGSGGDGSDVTSGTGGSGEGGGTARTGEGDRTSETSGSSEDCGSGGDSGTDGNSGYGAGGTAGTGEGDRTNGTSGTGEGHRTNGTGEGDRTNGTSGTGEGCGTSGDDRTFGTSGTRGTRGTGEGCRTSGTSGSGESHRTSGTTGRAEGGRGRFDVGDGGWSDSCEGYGGGARRGDSDGRGGGTGLAALRELVEGLGGSFHAASTAQGFAVRATLPDPPPDGANGPDPASSANVLALSGPGPKRGGPALGDEPSETRRAHDEARGHARRSLTTAVAVPLALTASLVGLAFLLLWWVSANSVLPPQDYDRLSVGDDRSEVERVLPRFAYPERSVDPLPPRPPGADCRFYLVSSEGGLPPVYRLCFADGVLVAKDEFERTDD